jgi:thymidylate synthase
MSNQFFIRSNKLYLTTYIRSNDCIKGITFDIPWFISLMYVMRNELLVIYPELELGSYTHFAGSLHIYERDFELVNNMLKNEFIHDSIKMPEITDNPILNPNSTWINYLRDELKNYDNIKFIE